MINLDNKRVGIFVFTFTINHTSSNFKNSFDTASILFNLCSIHVLFSLFDDVHINQSGMYTICMCIYLLLAKVYPFNRINI